MRVSRRGRRRARPFIAQGLATKSGSFESLNCAPDVGRSIVCAQMRCTELTLMPVNLAIMAVIDPVGRLGGRVAQRQCATHFRSSHLGAERRDAEMAILSRSRPS